MVHLQISVANIVLIWMACEMMQFKETKRTHALMTVYDLLQILASLLHHIMCIMCIKCQITQVPSGILRNGSLFFNVFIFLKHFGSLCTTVIMLKVLLWSCNLRIWGFTRKLHIWNEKKKRNLFGLRRYENNDLHF